MRRLDTFSRFESGVYNLLASITVCGGPLVVIFVADPVFLKDMSPFIRYPLWVVGMVLWFPLGIIVSGWIETLFKSLRTRLGMRSFSEIEVADLEKRSEARIVDEDREERWFTERPENVQRYRLWLLQRDLVEQFRKTNANLEVVKFLLVGLLIFLVAMKIF